MLRMAGARKYVEFACGVPEHPDVSLIDGQEFSEQAIEVVTEQTTSALLELRGIDQVRRPDLTHMNLQGRIEPDECTGRTGMVNVDVSEKKVAEISNFDTVIGESLDKPRDRTRGTAVHESWLVAVEQVGADDALVCLVMQVDQDRCHEQIVTRQPASLPR